MNRICLMAILLLSLEVHSDIFHLEKTPELGVIGNFKASDLCIVAGNTGHYLQDYADDAFAVHAGTIVKANITLDHIKQTLAFICKTYQDDVKAKRQSRLHDRAFLTEHFDFYRWSPDTETAKEIAKKSTNSIKANMLNNIKSDQIFLTKYYTKLLDASPVKTAFYNQALYSLPADEIGLSLEQAEQKKSSLTRFKYTRQQVIEGALNTNQLATPLVWITEEALHDVLLQGTGVLDVAGKLRFFNVHRNNDIAYDYSIGKREQARYWYFAEVPSIMGYGKSLASKIAVKPQVTFAGNVADLGLGKLIMVSYSQSEANDQQVISRLGILADQGGAFDNNLFQLDLLVDSYRGWSDYHQANRNLPDYAKAWVMILKNVH